MGSSSSKKKFSELNNDISLQDVTEFNKHIRPPEYSKINNNYDDNWNTEHLQVLINNVENSSFGSSERILHLRNLYAYLCILSNISKFPNKIYEPLDCCQVFKISGNILESARFILNNPPKKNWSLVNGLFKIDN